MDDIIKIHRIGFLQSVLILPIDLCNGKPPVIPGCLCLQLVGIQELVLGTTDLSQNGLGGELLFGYVHIGQAALDDTLAVVRIVNGKASVIPQPFDLLPQNPHACGMKGRRMYIPPLLPKHSFQPGFQFPCRLICKGDGKNIPWPDRRRCNHIPQPVNIRFPTIHIAL